MMKFQTLKIVLRQKLNLVKKIPLTISQRFSGILFNA